MKYLLLVLLLICLLGCSSNPVSSIDPEFIIGTWTGTSLATYPGVADEPITDEEPIRFVFTESTFQYYRTGEGGSNSIPFGGGNYNISDSTIIFTDVLCGYYPPMMVLGGEFEYDLIDGTLSLVQDPPGFFPTYHLVTLEKTEGVYHK
ncbi:MAG: hypothetical protein GY855_11875 [candidate division Zixibacteria bacterium]|nr:hypothetical protein [candidate division Zixibacteria bacterium]